MRISLHERDCIRQATFEVAGPGEPIGPRRQMQGVTRVKNAHPRRWGELTGSSVFPKTLRYTEEAMRRSAVLLVMLFAMLWQSMALARPGSTVNVMADFEHAALHWQGEGHHHHEDGSFHQDDSQASTFHVLSDHLTVTTALLPTSLHHLPPSDAARSGVLHDARVPDPFLDGPLRPPRSDA